MSPDSTRCKKEVDDNLSIMSTKQQTLFLLSELPESSSAWRVLYDDARMLRDIAAAEEDVRTGREHPLANAKDVFDRKWGLSHW